MNTEGTLSEHNASESILIRDARFLLTVPHRAAVYTVCTLFALTLNYCLGKEVGTDVLSYHMYAGLSAVHDRFGQDYFAAGAQGYFNPYAYAPFYLLATSGLPALAVASFLAIAQSVGLWCVFELGVILAPRTTNSSRLLTGLIAVIMASLNPVLLQQIGTSFTDLSTATLVLAAWVLLARALTAGSTPLLIAAGGVVGIACAFKLTNLACAIASLAVFALVPASIYARLSNTFIYGLSMLFGFFTTCLPWSLKLFKTFGNPFFPLVNGVFRSHEFTTESLRHYRFLPDGLLDALVRPFEMTKTMGMVHVEMLAPDLRYVFLIVLVIVVMGVLRLSSDLQRASDRTNSQLLPAFGAVFIAYWAIWLFESGNSRYFISGGCLAGVLIAALCGRLQENYPKSIVYGLIAMVGLQCAQLCMGTDFRRYSASWGGPWFDIKIPQQQREHANLYLVQGVQTNSFIAAYLPEGSGLIDFSGGYPMDPKGANGKRIKDMILKFSPNVRFLTATDRLYQEADKHMPTEQSVNIALAGYHLRLDSNDCTVIEVGGMSRESHGVTSGYPANLQTIAGDLPLLTCKLVSAQTDEQYAKQLDQQRTPDRILDQLEDSCPALFKPRRPATEYDGHRWLRRYYATDTFAWISRGDVKFAQVERPTGVVYLGREHEWAEAPKTLTCGRKDGLFFARVVEH